MIDRFFDYFSKFDNYITLLTFSIDLFKNLSQ